MKMRAEMAPLCAGLILIVATAAAAQTATPAAAVQARQGQYREIGTAYKAINDELRKPAPGKFALSSSAKQIATNLRNVTKLFPAGSGPSAVPKTKALPAVWSDQAGFVRRNNAAIVEADKLVAALRGTDMAAVGAQAKVLGGTCKACHQQFRAED